MCGQIFWHGKRCLYAIERQGASRWWFSGEFHKPAARGIEALTTFAEERGIDPMEILAETDPDQPICQLINNRSRMDYPSDQKLT